MCSRWSVLGDAFVNDRYPCPSGEHEPDSTGRDTALVAGFAHYHGDYQIIGQAPGAVLAQGMFRLRAEVTMIRISGQMLAALLILTVGIVLLLGNMGVFELRQILRFWPVLLIAVGVKELFERKEGRSSGVVAVLIIVAAIFLVSRFGPEGTLMSDPAAAGRSGQINLSAALGGVNHRNTASSFTGGSASALMGAIDLDLRDATMTDDEATVEVFTMMGGVKIRVPETWTVETRLTPILGGVENRTRQPDGSSKRLIVTGTVFMGGLDIRN
jgi:predicted membrane protein